MRTKKEQKGHTKIQRTIRKNPLNHLTFHPNQFLILSCATFNQKHKPLNQKHKPLNNKSIAPLSSGAPFSQNTSFKSLKIQLLTSFFSLPLATSKYFTSFSIPMKLRPVFAQATPVVPLPMNGSRTTSPSLE